MNRKAKLKKKIGEINPLAVLRRTNMRKKLKNRTVSLLVPNCLGGILFHDLGLKFRSPTVNLMMTQTDFLRFVQDLDGYLAAELEFYASTEHKCPCAMLRDVSICFTHFKTEEEAREKWQERAKRIDRDNLFIFAEERDGLTEEQIRAFGSLPAKGVAVFTAREYPDIPWAVYIPKYAKDGEVGNILRRNYVNDSREYEKYFDFVKWFNEADGKDLNVRPFIKTR